MEDSIKSLKIWWCKADNVCHAPSNFQRLHKLKFFQQKLKFFSNKKFFSSHLIPFYNCILAERTSVHRCLRPGLNGTEWYRILKFKSLKCQKTRRQN